MGKVHGALSLTCQSSLAPLQRSLMSLSSWLTSTPVPLPAGAWDPSLEPSWQYKRFRRRDLEKMRGAPGTLKGRDILMKFKLFMKEKGYMKIANASQFQIPLTTM